MAGPYGFVSLDDEIYAALSPIYGTGLSVNDLLARYWADATRGNSDGLGRRYGDAWYAYMAAKFPAVASIPGLADREYAFWPLVV